MNQVVDLTRVGTGFGDAGMDAQRVFRAALRALAHPGLLQTVAANLVPPPGAQLPAAAVLLALLDHDCSLWLSPRLATGDAGSWMRFHTGCRLVEQPASAQFVWATGDELPDLDSLALGSEFDPELAATCVVQVAALSNQEQAGAWSLSGPGIRARQALRVDGLRDAFVDQWRGTRAWFPRGVDVLFSAGGDIAGLPRTSIIED